MHEIIVNVLESLRIVKYQTKNRIYFYLIVQLNIHSGIGVDY